MIEELRIFDEHRVIKLLKQRGGYKPTRDAYVQLEEMIIDRMFDKLMDNKKRKNKMEELLKSMK